MVIEGLIVSAIAVGMLVWNAHVMSNVSCFTLHAR